MKHNTPTTIYTKSFDAHDVTMATLHNSVQAYDALTYSYFHGSVRGPQLRLRDVLSHMDKQRRLESGRPVAIRSYRDA